MQLMDCWVRRRLFLYDVGLAEVGVEQPVPVSRECPPVEAFEASLHQVSDP